MKSDSIFLAVIELLIQPSTIEMRIYHLTTKPLSFENHVSLIFTSLDVLCCSAI
jgi:hypothetical protein